MNKALSTTCLPAPEQKPEGTDMHIANQKFLSRRGFCLCCAGGVAAAGLALTPRAAYAQARAIVLFIKDDAAIADISVHRLRRNVTVLQGSGGNIAVLTGADG